MADVAVLVDDGQVLVDAFDVTVDGSFTFPGSAVAPPTFTSLTDMPATSSAAIDQGTSTVALDRPATRT